MRPAFRLLAWIFGPLLVCAGGLLIVLDLLGRQPRGSPGWVRVVHAGLWLGLGNLALGYVIFRTARTGEDPYVELRPEKTDAENSG
ncbi:MAG: hypothetical protein ACREL3_05325 [Gemmatimonadales bacterium]